MPAKPSKFLSRLFKRPIDSSTPSSSSTSPEAVVWPQGLQVVYEGLEPEVDIVAVHGLNGHQQKTWTADNGVHWLRDLLPKDIPSARILCWGYDANTHSSSRVSCQYLYDHAQSLVADLTRKRILTNSSQRPIIFVAHSLGGIVLKSALVHSELAREGALLEHRSIKVSTYGIIFMGTPHQGGNGAELGRLLVNIASLFISADDRIIKHLEKDSEWLQQQLRQYGPISRDFVTKFAYEEYETPTAFGHTIMVVPKTSAVVPGYADIEPLVIHANHKNMVRFMSKEDKSYNTISENLQIMVLQAPDTIRSKWEAETRIDDARENYSHQFSLPTNLSQVTEVTRFVAREGELEKIHEVLGNTGERRTAILHGLGGMGKTQLSIAYVKRYSASYTASIWLNARDEVSLKKSFIHAAEHILRQYPSITYLKEAIQTQDLDDCVDAVKRWLDIPRNNKWLLVYDNYDDPKLDGSGSGITTTHSTPQEGNTRAGIESDSPLLSKGFDIRRYFPQSYHGAVLVTTRSSNVKIGELIRLRKLESIEESLEILASTSYRQNLVQDPAAVELARLLDGFPLALSTAGTYLDQVSTTWGEYLKLYQESWSRLQQESPRLLPYEHAMYSTWNISYMRVERQNPNSAKLLRLWAYFDKDDFWYELLPKKMIGSIPWLQLVTEDRISFDQTMRVLCDHGLVEANMSTSEFGSESKGYSMHGCVHSWINHAINHALHKIIHNEMAQLAILCIGSRVPNIDEREHWSIQRRLLHHADRCTELIIGGIQMDDEDIWAVGRLGYLYDHLGKFREAEEMYTRALQIKERVLGPDHTSTLRTVNNLGLNYRYQGKLKKAEEMYTRALRGFEKVLGPDHTSTLDTFNNLGTLYEDQGKLKKAEEVYTRALRGFEKALGPDHTSTLGTVNNLGLLYGNQGKFEEAEDMSTRALRGFEKALGPDHTSTLRTVNNLGLLYKDQGKLKKAEDMYTRALHGKEKVLGPDHTSTLSTVHNLGVLYADQGKLKKAEEMYTRALQGKEKALGPDHTSTLGTVKHLGLLYENQGKLEEAEEMSTRALQGFEKALGPDHTSTLGTVNNLGLLYGNQGKFEEAEEMYTRALQGKEKVLGPDHTSTLCTIHNLGVLYRNQGKLKKAEEMHTRALRGFEEALGLDHTYTLGTVKNLVLIYKSQGKLEEAEEMYTRALQGKEKALGQDHTLNLGTVHNTLCIR